MSKDRSFTEYLDDIDAGFNLSHAFLVDRTQALTVTAESIRALSTFHTRQQKRQYYDRKSKKPREIVVLPKPFLLQSLIFRESTKYEIKQEEELQRGERAIHENTLLLRFIKHLVQVSLSRSFFLTVSMCRILHDYSHRETKLIYESLLQGVKLEEQGEPDPRYKDDDAYRHWKKFVMDETEIRFNGLLLRRTLSHGEERFIPQDDISSLIAYSQKCFKLLTPWKTEHVLPEGWTINCSDIPAFKFEDGYRDAEHAYEVNRMHGILDPHCFSIYTKGLGCPVPEKKLDLPRFFLTDKKDDAMKPPADLDNFVTPERDELRAILSGLTVESRKRRKLFAPVLSIVVDDLQQTTSFNPRESKSTLLTLDSSAELLKIIALENNEEILLSTMLIGFSGVRDGQPWQSALTLEGKQEISLSITPVWVNGVVAKLAVEVGYREKSPVKAAHLSYLQLKNKIDGLNIGWMQMARLITTICIIALALIPGIVAYRALNIGVGTAPDRQNVIIVQINLTQEKIKGTTWEDTNVFADSKARDTATALFSTNDNNNEYNCWGRKVPISLSQLTGISNDRDYINSRETAWNINNAAAYNQSFASAALKSLLPNALLLNRIYNQRPLNQYDVRMQWLLWEADDLYNTNEWVNVTKDTRLDKSREYVNFSADIMVSDYNQSILESRSRTYMDWLKLNTSESRLAAAIITRLGLSSNHWIGFCPPYSHHINQQYGSLFEGNDFKDRSDRLVNAKPRARRRPRIAKTPRHITVDSPPSSNFIDVEDGRSFNGPYWVGHRAVQTPDLLP